MESATVGIHRPAQPCYHRLTPGGLADMNGRKTNVMRILESLGIAFQVASYPVGEEHLDATHVAHQLGVSADIVFKTLVARDEKRTPLVFCVPAASELDLKKAAAACGGKKVELIGLKELTPLTGYVRGGCSPIGMKKKFPTWIDEIAQTFPLIYVNAGARGLQVILAPPDLARAAEARFADLA
jgi:Cys-tRNA(Pro)/Cys-tRNA(Cys) deacylase